MSTLLHRNSVAIVTPVDRDDERHTEIAQQLTHRLAGLGVGIGRVGVDHVYHRVDVALQRGLRTYVNMVDTRENFSDLEALLEFCEDRGVLMNAQSDPSVAIR